MPTELDDTLQAVAAEVLESMAFVLQAMDEPDGDGSGDEDRVCGRISFAGHFSGSLELCLSGSVLSEVASNMLGLDFGVDASPDHRRDAFKELMNVICGNLLPRIAGDEAVFDVGSAEILPLPQPTGPSPTARATLALDGGTAEMKLWAPGLSEQPA